MKTKTFAWLSTAIVWASVMAGCGLSPSANIHSPALSSAKLQVFADGMGKARRLGYRLGRHTTLNLPSLNRVETTLPSSVDMRKTGTVSPVYDQGDLGSCTAFAVGGGMRETLTNMAGEGPRAYSPLYLYYKERELHGWVNSDTGAYMIDGMTVLSNSGDCLDSTIPYDIANFKEKPSAVAEKEAADYRIDSYTLLKTLDELKTQLAEGHPAVFGFTMYDSFFDPLITKTGMMPMPQVGEFIVGGHAVFVVGYDDAKQVLIIRNSWGGKWGDKGYFYMPYAYVSPENVSEIYVASAHN